MEVAVLAGMAAGMAADLRGIFSVIEREVALTREGHLPSPALAERLAYANDLVADLVRVSQCPVHESVQHVDVADAVRAAMAEESPRAARRGVALVPVVPARLDIESRPGAVLLAARLLISEAVAATPAGGRVTVVLEHENAGRGARLQVEDGGQRIPSEAWAGLVTARLQSINRGATRIGGALLGANARPPSWRVVQHGDARRSGRGGRAQVSRELSSGRSGRMSERPRNNAHATARALTVLVGRTTPAHTTARFHLTQERQQAQRLAEVGRGARRGGQRAGSSMIFSLIITMGTVRVLSVARSFAHTSRPSY